MAGLDFSNIRNDRGPALIDAFNGSAQERRS